MTVTDPDQLRISDADRHKVAEVLRDAAGEGRLDLDELDERLEATYAAKVYADLVPIVVDLPGNQLDLRRRGTGAPTAATRQRAAVRHDTSLAIMGGRTARACGRSDPPTRVHADGRHHHRPPEAVFAEPRW